MKFWIGTTARAVLTFALALLGALVLMRLILGGITTDDTAYAVFMAALAGMLSGCMSVAICYDERDL